ncbi:MAG: hypothetical protein ACRDG8_05190 [Actinomycetota bacterium]
MLASEDTARRSAGAAVRFEPIGPVVLKGVAEPVELLQARRDPSGPGH